VRAVVGPVPGLATTTSRRGVIRQAGGHLYAVRPQSESALRNQGSSASADNDTAHRLALWLADVSAEAASGQMAPQPSPTASVTPRPRARESPR
jgi:hypothetical protein